MVDFGLLTCLENQLLLTIVFMEGRYHEKELIKLNNFDRATVEVVNETKPGAHTALCAAHSRLRYGN
jgi:hypothetical protein